MANAMARPIPAPPPVTIATLSASRIPCLAESQPQASANARYMGQALNLFVFIRVSAFGGRFHPLG
jgi:hypothetical protein